MGATSVSDVRNNTNTELPLEFKEMASSVRNKCRFHDQKQLSTGSKFVCQQKNDMAHFPQSNIDSP